MNFERRKTMSTLDFKTKTMIKAKENPSADGKFLVGIDVGYSGCKIFSQNKVALFPCYARQIDGELIAASYEDTDILYQDARTKKIWAVGETAIGMMSSRETNDNSVSMYSRSRYEDPMFMVILRTGLALGVISNQFGGYDGKELYVETGLPAAYMADEYALRDAFCQEHEFALKVGNTPWQKFNISLDEDHVFVTSQPKGTLYSSIINEKGEFVSNSTKILKSRALIFDAGFNTLDLVRNMNGIIDNNCISYDDLGMKAVFTETASAIEKKYREHIEIPYMQYVLRTGVLQGYDRKARSTIDIDIAAILEEKNREVCQRAIGKIRGMYNDLLDMDYLVVTGGTGEAWWNIIKDEFKGLRTLTVLSGNENSDLPFTFSNVRGYYFHMYRTVKKKS
jgi:plasmid segregation protein ParM